MVTSQTDGNCNLPAEAQAVAELRKAMFSWGSGRVVGSRKQTRKMEGVGGEKGEAGAMVSGGEKGGRARARERERRAGFVQQ